MQQPLGATNQFGSLDDMYKQAWADPTFKTKMRNFEKYLIWMVDIKNKSQKWILNNWYEPNEFYDFMYVYFTTHKGKANGNTCKKIIADINSFANMIGKGINIVDQVRFRRLSKAMNKIIKYKKRERRPLSWVILKAMWLGPWFIKNGFNKDRIHGLKLLRGLFSKSYMFLIEIFSIYIKQSTLIDSWEN